MGELERVGGEGRWRGWVESEWRVNGEGGWMESGWVESGWRRGGWVIVIRTFDVQW